MKYIVIVGDGMADWPIAELGNKTILQYAHTPYMDMLASKGRTGMLRSVPDGFHPGSEVANMSLLGYDLPTVFEGRGVLEAANIGVDIKPGEMCMRCNLITIEDNRIKNHSAGHISTEESTQLIDALEEQLGGDGIHFYAGIQYRHLLVIEDGNKQLQCTPPHDVPGQMFPPLLVKPMVVDAQSTADRVNSLIMRSQQILENHPVNVRRRMEGKDMANSIWPWSPGYRPSMRHLSERFPFIKSASVISAVDLIKGIGIYAGMRVIEVEGATGLFDTNYKNKAEAAIEALRVDDFVYLHVEAPDEAGHEGNVPLKVRTVEDLDSKLIAPIVEAIENFDEPVTIAVLPDHPTPCVHRTHTSDPIPFLIYNPNHVADGVREYSETACSEGIYGTLESKEFIEKLFS